MRFGIGLSLTMILFAVVKTQAFTLEFLPDQKGYENPEISIDYNQASCPAGFDLASVVSNAVEAWNKAPTSNLKLSLGNPSSSTNLSYPPVAFCDPTMTGNRAGAGVSIPDASLYLQAGYLKFNTNSSAAGYILNASFDQQVVVAAHELGHVIGLGHSQDSAALMYYDLTNKGEATLSQDDVDGATYLYPKDELKNDKMLGGCGLVKPHGGSGSAPFLFLILLIPVFLLAMFRRYSIKKVLAV